MAQGDVAQFVQLKKLLKNRKYPKAERLVRRIQAKAPRNVELLLVRHEIALQLKKPRDAEQSLALALKTAPQNPAVRAAEARFVGQNGSLDAAIRTLGTYLQGAEAPDLRAMLCKRLLDANRPAAALDALAPLGGSPGARAAFLRGQCLERLGRAAEAVAAYDQVPPDAPEGGNAHLARAYQKMIPLKDDARTDLQDVLARDPQNVTALGLFLNACLRACDWDRFDQALPVWQKLQGTQGDVGWGANGPWMLLPLADDGFAARDRMRAHVKRKLTHLGLPAPVKAPAPAKAADGRIRVGYFSNDFHDHATMKLLGGVLRHHNHDRIDLHCFDYTDRSKGAPGGIHPFFDKVHDISGLADAEVVARAWTSPSI